MENGKKVEKKEVTKTLTFSNNLLGSVSISREKLVASIENEHRSYANHSFVIEGQKSFTLPELTEFPAGFSLGLVIHLKDNANSDGAKKGKLEL
jgi:hypothetical protein